MEAIQMFRASDGTLFGSADEAATHEKILAHKAKIPEFLDSLYPIKGRRSPARSIAEKTVEAWLRQN